MSNQVGESHSNAELSAAIGAAAAQAVLGGHRGTYPAVIPGWTKVHTFFTVLWPVLAIWAVMAGNPSYAVIPMLLLVGMGGLYLRIGAVARRNRTRRIDLYDAGLTVASDGQVRVARFDSTSVLQNIVRHYRNGVYKGTSYHYTVTDLHGRPLKLDGGTYVNPRAWGEAIQQAVTSAQLPLATRALTAGHRLQFGDVWMTAQEVGAGRKSVLWQQIDEVSVDKGAIVLAVAGKLMPLTAKMVKDIPNHIVFLALADQLRAAHPGR
ncbi:hypothetical protein GZH49_25135 [Nocardia terpenica]|uniref:DUF6585 family protein n=1 Tax=Nocardia terpenica TaxID=455432 RepID=UPI002FE38EA9